MLIMVECKVEFMKEFVIKEGDIGFLEIQVVILIEWINNLIEYFKEYGKDNYFCCGFLKMVVQCWFFLDYMCGKSEECYKMLIMCLGICC